MMKLRAILGCSVSFKFLSFFRCDGNRKMENIAILFNRAMPPFLHLLLSLCLQ